MWTGSRSAAGVRMGSGDAAELKMGTVTVSPGLLGSGVAHQSNLGEETRGSGRTRLMQLLQQQ